jgi:hypothetical protein
MINKRDKIPVHLYLEADGDTFLIFDYIYLHYKISLKRPPIVLLVWLYGFV